ncbi:MAG: 23S rRNA (guanosine(2251)-2'-O)-methyltransferase RlmB [Gammaproteobacteria bacterium]|nr:23S rRNA (guanosine(2251)-2'-O)-methyltransferase RlmB [Gammaproteobacteria bacterium]
MSEQRLFGIHAVEALLTRDPSRLRQLWLVKGDLSTRLAKLAEQASAAGVAIEWRSRDELDAQSAGQRHQGVVAWSHGAERLSDQDLDGVLDSLTEAPFLLVLDGVQDPHNLGACLRSADAAGVHAVIVPKDRATGITDIVSKVACGAAEAVPFFQVTNLARVLRDLQQRGIWLVGLDERGEQTLFDMDLTGPLALVLGAEGGGLRRLTREHCDHVAVIPMAGTVSSLNVSVATGVCLFEARRQRLGQAG